MTHRLALVTLFAGACFTGTRTPSTAPTALAIQPGTDAIAFSTTPIDADAARATNLKAKFRLGEPIYGRLFLSTDIAALGDVLKQRVFVEGIERECEWSMYRSAQPRISQELASATSMPLFLLPALDGNASSGAAAAVNEDAMYCSSFFAALPPGNHLVHVRFPGTRAIEATFEIEVTSSATSKLAQLAAKADAAKATADAAAQSLPAAAMHAANLESEFIAAFRTRNAPGEPLKVVITDADWRVQRQEGTGLILHRSLSATMAIKLADGTCALRYLSIEQPWTGKAYGKTALDRTAIANETTSLACENVR